MTNDTPEQPSGPVQPRSLLYRWTLRLARLALLIYLGLCLVIYLFQTWMIFPGKSSQGKPQSIVVARKDEELITLITAGGDRVVALFGPALNANGSPRADAAQRPTILYFYGNAETIAASQQVFMDFRRLGCNVLIPDFAGYGMSGGSPSERTIYETADVVWDHLLKRKDIDPKRIIVAGRSLGAAAAIHLASRYPTAGLATFSAFTSMTDMAHKLLPWFPTKWLLRHRFENEQKLAGVHCPYFIAHGTEDELVPFGMSTRLAASARGPVTTFNVINASHNDVMDVGGRELLHAFKKFIDVTGAVTKP